tara:strand:+ start:1731 stop:2018 length:288 start_codon:yes stop_codon:yes gene_type:complete
MNVSELEKIVSSKEKTLVKLGASWCGPCKQADIVLKKVDKEVDNKVVIIDVEKSIEIGSQFKIKNLPTFIIFQNGEVVERFNKRHSKDEFIKKLS